MHGNYFIHLFSSINPSIESIFFIKITFLSSVECFYIQNQCSFFIEYFNRLSALYFSFIFCISFSFYLFQYIFETVFTLSWSFKLSFVHFYASIPGFSFSPSYWFIFLSSHFPHRREESILCLFLFRRRRKIKTRPCAPNDD